MPALLERTIPVPRYRFQEPRRNLPGRKGVATAEDRFTIAFARSYQERFQAIHHGALADQLSLVREIPVNGYGITDLMAIAWSGPGAVCPDVRAFLANAKPTVRAFEMKLGDWRRAMVQASRYRNFAHQSIAVIPMEKSSVAVEYLDTFRRIKVGLWLFDANTGVIRPVFTPRILAPRSSRYHMESLEKAATSARPALPIL